MASPISPDEDCFSLIEKVHTAQLQKGVVKGEQRKGKGGGKKDKKDGGSKQQSGMLQCELSVKEDNRDNI